ncbi:MAG: hypothetical protein F6J87_16955 [Spirulina sp. SIO3F2]|nr:hypothetical protein [Spirulina sp. SIO3F2]
MAGTEALVVAWAWTWMWTLTWAGVGFGVLALTLALALSGAWVKEKDDLNAYPKSWRFLMFGLTSTLGLVFGANLGEVLK